MEKTKIVIVCEDSEDSKSNNVTVYTNNPHADAADLLSMLSAHIGYFIRTLMLDHHMSPSDVAKMIEAAVKIATDRHMDNKKGVE